MPCRVDPTPEELEASRQASARTRERAERTEAAEKAKTVAEKAKQKAEEQINFLSVQLDYTRDLLFRLWYELSDPWGAIDNTEVGEEVQKVLKIQVKHRQADLDRLITTLAKNPTAKNKEALRRVLDADPSKPLEPQLGFNPDEF